MPESVDEETRRTRPLVGTLPALGPVSLGDWEASTVKSDVSLRRTLERVCQAASDTAGATGGGVVLVHRGEHLGVLAATADLVRLDDEAQRRTGEGPVRDAIDADAWRWSRGDGATSRRSLTPWGPF